MLTYTCKLETPTYQLIRGNRDHLTCVRGFWWVCREGRRRQWHPLQCSCLENPSSHGGAWWAAVHGLLRVGHDWATSLSLFTFMHSRRKWQPTPVFLPRKSQGREPGALPSIGLHRVGHDWRDLAAAEKTIQEKYTAQPFLASKMYKHGSILSGLKSTS